MNPYESPPEQQPVPLTDGAPLQGLEKLAFIAKLYRYLYLAALIGLIVFLGLFVWAVLSGERPE